MTPDSTTRVERATELHRRGVQALQGQRAALAAECIGEALRLDPTSVPACVNYGTALHELRRFEEAVQSCDRAIALDPSCAPAFYNRGNALRELRRHEAAVASYDRAIVIQPTHGEAYLNRGLALADLGRHTDAVVSYERAIALQPQHPDPHFNRANQLRQLGRLLEALAGYDMAIGLQPGFAGAHLNRGTVLVELRRYPEAMLSFDRAIACQPTLAEAHFNRAGALQHLGRYLAAVAGYEQGLALDPRRAQAHADRGRALRELRRYEEAILSYDRALDLDPGATELRCVRRHIQMQIADWRGLEDDLGRITAAVDAGHAVGNPFFLLPLCDVPRLQRRAAERWAAAARPGPTAEHAMPPPAPAGRIHIGYFSADFHEHATSYLIAQLFELHDRSRFKITAFSFGPPSSGAMRRRLQAACDDFIDVRSEADAAIATRARRLAIDIAVDLKGFTQDNRIGIFAHRAAPLQVNFLGYPGTLGASFIDYLIADRTLVPAETEADYAEKIIFLPDSYQVNDTTRAIASKTFTRRELHLPDEGFVFCCFNNAYKILPATFDCWMRILRQVEGSVLWLLGDNPSMIRNLRREAENRGVSPDRLIFAARTALADHLARHAGADLFLDTLPCNAHTTASDALWAGLPVLTCPGESFAARVAASLLRAIALADLIAPTPQLYEEIAIALAGDPQALTAIRSRLQAQRLSSPLFDTPRYCRHLEQAFADIDARRRAGLPTEHRR